MKKPKYSVCVHSGMNFTVFPIDKQSKYCLFLPTFISEFTNANDFFEPSHAVLGIDFHCILCLSWLWNFSFFGCQSQAIVPKN
ncbi:MAG: hypothetical protein K9J46_08295 [Saprospiraceae bacterium]|nr:hypothetical protein [Saprospiraceae bacterium]